MTQCVKTVKLHLHVKNQQIIDLFDATASAYRDACNYISQYIFDHEFILNSYALSKNLYHDIRNLFGLKSQMAQSAIKTVTACYKSVREQLQSHPYKCVYKEAGVEKVTYFQRNLEWLQKPVRFTRPQADFVRNRDYSFMDNFQTLSINTLDGRVRLTFDLPDYFKDYFDGSWKFGTGRLVNLLGEWYFHIPMTKEIEHEQNTETPAHIVGIDRGLRFLVTAYDDKGVTTFISGQQILKKREQFATTRAELQTKGTKSAKRALKRISGRENRWMSDVNHQISKTLVQEYGPDTLFVLEDLTNVSFSTRNLKLRANQNRDFRSWSFYQFEQFLTYKAQDAGSEVIKVSPGYTSQRCPKCGRIHRKNRKHEKHEYVCDHCGYCSNDDRIAAMNIQFLGRLYVSGDNHPHIRSEKEN